METVTATREPASMEMDPAVPPAGMVAVGPQAMAPGMAQPPAPGTDEDDHAHEISNARVIFRCSAQVGELFGAIAAAQSMDGYGDIEKTKKARIESRKEGARSYEYTYETLKDVIAATQPFLAKHGVAQVQLPFPGQRAVTIRTILAHSSGQWMYNDLSAVIPMPDPQGVGSGISYLRRYAMKAICNVAADDDDDAQAASRPAPQPPPRAAQRASAVAPPPPAAAAAPQAPQAARPNVGKITSIQKRDGGAIVRLDTGFACSTRDLELVEALEGHYRAGVTLELVTRASSDPAKYPPILVELVLRAEARA